MPKCWLLKTEPREYSFTQLVIDRRTTWDGVKNNLALKNLKEMKKGDRVLIYHTGSEKAIVGIAEVISNPYPDPNRKDPKRLVVDIKPVQKLPKSVTLAKIKSQKQFSQFDLVKLPRLSVMPVSTSQWRALLPLGGL